jgi:hypothetical protein
VSTAHNSISINSIVFFCKARGLQFEIFDSRGATGVRFLKSPAIQLFEFEWVSKSYASDNTLLEMMGAKEDSLQNFKIFDPECAAEFMSFLLTPLGWSFDYQRNLKIFFRVLFMNHGFIQKIALPQGFSGRGSTPALYRKKNFLQIHCFPWPELPEQVLESESGNVLEENASADIFKKITGFQWSLDPRRESFLIAPAQTLYGPLQLTEESRSWGPLSCSVPLEVSYNQKAVNLYFWAPWPKNGPWNELLELLECFLKSSGCLVLSSSLALIPGQEAATSFLLQPGGTLRFIQDFNEELGYQVEQVLGSRYIKV